LSGQVSRHLLGRGGEILIGDDVVSVEHVACSVAAYSHRDFFWNAGADHIPHGTPPKIMKQASVKLGSVARGLPGLVERS
jgi:hypothetical protein